MKLTSRFWPLLVFTFVGYQSIVLGPKFNLFTATFNGVGKDLNLQEVVCTQQDGTEWKASGRSAVKCDGDVLLQKTDRDGNYGTVYKYFSTKTPVGWYYSQEGVDTYAENAKITKDDGILVQNGHSVGAAFRVSGEVDLNPFVVLPPKFSITGNFTPVELDIQEIGCTQQDGTEWKASGRSAVKCDGDVLFQFSDEDGNYGTVYKYFSTKDPVGWYYSKEGVDTYATDVKLAPGKGILVQNGHSVGAAFKLKSPITDK